MRRLFILSAVAVAALAATSAASTPKPPKTVTAHKITRPPGTLKPGSVVSSSSLVGPRTFVNGHGDGFALANTQQAQYPAATTDGGHTWKTDGPALHVDALQAP